MLSVTDSYSDVLHGAAARGECYSHESQLDDILSCVYKWILGSEALGESKYTCKQTVSQ